MITCSELKKLLSYDPLTGVFTNRVTRGRAKAGAVVGSPHVDGYLTVMLAGKNHMLRRLAWLYVTGRSPTNDIDHADGDRDNNRFTNLRAATRAENCQNATLKSNNRSGITGVWKVGLRWRARVSVEGVHTHVGYFDTKEEAEGARLAAKARLNKFQPVPRNLLSKLDL